MSGTDNSGITEQIEEHIDDARLHFTNCWYNANSNLTQINHGWNKVVIMQAELTKSLESFDIPNEASAQLLMITLRIQESAQYIQNLQDLSKEISLAEEQANKAISLLADLKNKGKSNA